MCVRDREPQSVKKWKRDRWRPLILSGFRDWRFYSWSCSLFNAKQISHNYKRFTKDSLLLSYFFLKIIYSWETGRDIGRGRSRLPTGNLMLDSIPGPRNHDLSQRQTLNHWATQVTPEMTIIVQENGLFSSHLVSTGLSSTHGKNMEPRLSFLTHLQLFQSRALSNPKRPTNIFWSQTFIWETRKLRPRSQETHRHWHPGLVTLVQSIFLYDTHCSSEEG